MDDDEAALLAELRAISNRSAASRFQDDTSGVQGVVEESTTDAAAAEPDRLFASAPSAAAPSSNSDDAVEAKPLAKTTSDITSKEERLTCIEQETADEKPNGGFRLSSPDKKDQQMMSDIPAHSTNRFEAAPVGPEEQADEETADTSTSKSKRDQSELPPWKRGRKKSPPSEMTLANTGDSIKNSPTPVSQAQANNASPTFSGDRGGPAEDAALLAELRAISAKSGGANRFADTTSGEAQQEEEEKERIPLEDAPFKSPKPKKLAEEKSSTGRPLPPWKRGKKQSVKKDVDVEVVVAAPSEPEAEPPSLPAESGPANLEKAVASETIVESNAGFKSATSSTFTGERGGAAEDADLLAELKAISARSGGGQRFSGGDDQMASDDSTATDEIRTKRVSAAPAKKAPTPPWKRDRPEKQNGEANDEVLMSESSTTVSESATPPVATAPTARAGFQSDMASTFKGDRGGPAEDAALLAELRAISSKSTGRFSGDASGTEADGDNFTATPPPVAPPSAPIAQPLAGSAPPSTESSEPLVTIDTLPTAATDKNWKVRESAYDLLQKLLKDKVGRENDAFSVDGEQVLKGLDELVISMAADSNTKALDGALRFGIDYANHCRGAGSAEQAARIMRSLLKGNALSSRPTTAKLAVSYTLKLMEVGTDGASSVHSVTDVLLSQGLTSRKPKVVAASASLILEAAHAFGASSLPLASIVSSASTMLTHSNAAVRETGMKIVAEICRALGSRTPLQSVIDDLKSAQLSQLEKMLEAQPEPTPVGVGLRNQKSTSSGSPSDALAALEAGTKELEAERYAAREPVNIFPALAATEYSTRIKLPKWSEKVAALDIVLQCGGEKPYKLCQPSSSLNYQPLICEMKKLLSHSHCAVASKAMQVLSMLAEGVGERLYPYLRPLLTPLLGLMKDKKLTRAAGECLDTFFGNVIAFDHLLDKDDALPSATDERSQKNALARSSALEFLGRCLQRRDSAGPRGSFQATAAVAAALLCSKLLDDSDASVRKAALENLRLLLTVDDGKYSGDMDLILEDLKEKNTRSYKALKAAGGPSKKAAIESTSPGDTTSSSLKTDAKITTEAPSKTTTKRRIEPKQIASSGSKEILPHKRTPAVTESDSAEPSFVEALAQVDNFEIPSWRADEDDGGVLACLKSPTWLARQSGIKSLTAFVSSDNFRDLPGHLHTSALLAVVKEHTKGFKETNFNVAKSIIELFLALCVIHADAEQPFPEWASWDGARLAVDKIADKKLSRISSELLSELCVVQVPGAVMSRALEFLDGIKSPLSHEAFLDSCRQMLVDFGAPAFGNGVKAMVSWLVEECGQANPKVRKAALLVIGELHAQLGPSFKALILSCCKDASTTDHVESALDKNPFDKAAAEQERSKVCVISSSGGMADSADSGDQTSVLEAPKLDLVGALSDDCIERMGSKDGKTAWKTRKNAMDEVDNAMKKCNGLLLTDGPHLRALVDLLRALRERLSDSQSNLKPVAARLIGRTLSSVDKQTQPRLGKIVFAPLLSAAMNDNRKPMREASLESIRSGTTESDLEGASPNPLSLEVLMASLASELGDSEYKAGGIPDVLYFASNAAEHLPNLDSVTSSRGASLGEKLGSSIVGCLTSSKAETRSAAEGLLKAFVENGVISIGSAKKGMQKLLPAQQRSVGPVLSKLAGATSSRANKENDSQSREAAKAHDTRTSESLVRRVGGDAAKQKSDHKTAAKSASNRRAPVATGMSRDRRECSHPLLNSVTTVGRSKVSIRSINWPEYPEEPSGSTSFASLKKIMSPSLSENAIASLFPDEGIRKQEDAIPGCDLLSETITFERKSGGLAMVDHLDLILMWTAYALCSRENTVGFQAILSLLQKLALFLSESDCELSDAQGVLLLPYLFEKASVAKGRFGDELHNLLATLKNETVVPLKVLGQAVCVPLIEKSPHAKTRGLAYVECTECVDGVGLNAIGKKGVLLASKAMSTESLPENKAALLELMLTILDKMNGDIEKLARICGPSHLSDKSKSLLEERYSKRAASRPASARGRSQVPSSKGNRDVLDSISGVIDELPSLELRLGEGSYSPVGKAKNKGSVSSSGPFTFSFQSRHNNRTQDGNRYSGASRDDVSPVYADSDTRAIPETRRETDAPPAYESHKQSPISAAASLRARLLKIRGKGTEESGMVANSSSPPQSSWPVELRNSAGNGSGDVYQQSLKSIDRLLHKSKPLAEGDADLELCISALKTFHAALSNQPSTTVDVSFETLSALRQEIANNTVELIEHLTSVFVFALDCEDTRQTAGMSIPLMSVGLATLMALFRDPDISQNVSQDALTLLFREAGKALLDPRLSLSSQQEIQLDETTSSQMVRAVNKLAVQAATAAPRSISFMALLALQLQLCMQPHDMPSSLAFNIRLSRIVTKLFAKVIKAEDAKQIPFSPESVDLEALLCAIDDTLVSSSETPANHSMEDAATTCSNMTKPLVLSMLRSRAIGKEKIRACMSELGIDHDTSKLGALLRECEDQTLEASAAFDSPAKSKAMNIADLVSAVGSAPEGPERTAAVNELRRYNRLNGDTELKAHLEQVSATFRDYITNQLATASSPENSNLESGRDSISERIRSLRTKLSATEAAVQSVMEPPKSVIVKTRTVPETIMAPTSPSSPRKIPSATSTPTTSPTREPPKGSTASALRKRLAAAQESRHRAAAVEDGQSSSAYGHAAALRARLERVKQQSQSKTNSSSEM